MIFRRIIEQGRNKIEYCGRLVNYIKRCQQSAVCLDRKKFEQLIDKDWPCYGWLSMISQQYSLWIVKAPARTLIRYNILVGLALGEDEMLKASRKYPSLCDPKINKGNVDGIFYRKNQYFPCILGVSTDIGSFSQLDSTIRHELTHYFQYLNRALGKPSGHFNDDEHQANLTKAQLKKLQDAFPGISDHNWEYYLTPDQFEAFVEANMVPMFKKAFDMLEWKDEEQRDFFKKILLSAKKPYTADQLKARIKQAQKKLPVPYYMKYLKFYYGAYIIGRKKLVQKFNGIVVQKFDLD